MNDVARDRLFGYQHAFDDPATRWLVGLVAVLLVADLGWLLTVDRRGEWRRRAGWLVLVPVLLVPTLLGAAWTIITGALLSLVAYREYARATGLFREKIVSLLVVLGIVTVQLAVLDNWYLLFVALTPLVVAVLVGLPVLADRPAGYVQRAALAVVGFVLFGSALGHLGFLANDARYRPILLLVLIAAEVNHAAVLAGDKYLGRRRLCPNTDPDRTLAGALAGLLATILFVSLLGRMVFAETDLIRPVSRALFLVLLGGVLAVPAQLGGLVLAAVRRDLGLKELAGTLLGYRGLVTRLDGLTLVAPAVFHVVNYFVGIGLDQPICLFSGARA
jgi:phosphatidate cytidylyltransferase